MPYANNKGSDQPAHPRSLISTFVVCCLDSIIPLVSVSRILSLFLAAEAEQPVLSLTWSQTPKTGFLVTRLVCIMNQPIVISDRYANLHETIFFCSNQLLRVADNAYFRRGFLTAVCFLKKLQLQIHLFSFA